MTINDISKNYLQSAMTNLASGKRINTAADDAAGLAIMEGMESEIRGLEQGSRNTEDMQSLVNTAEGSLSTVSDGLNRIRELSVQAANGTNTDSDRAVIQEEVSQILDHIKTTTGNAEFNSIKLLDGSSKDLPLVSNPDGGGMDVSIPSVSDLLSGLEGYDVTKGVNLDAIDSAIQGITDLRAQLGAQSNRMDHTVNSNSITMLNQMAAKSRIADQDMAKGMMDWNKERVINDMMTYSAQMQMDQMRNKISLLQ